MLARKRRFPGVTPQPLQIVVSALIRREDVDDQISIIAHNPFAVRVSLDADRLLAELLLHLFGNLVPDRLRLALVGRRTDEEVVREGRNLA